MKMTWSEFKAICISKSLQMQMLERASDYKLFALDGIIRYETSFLKDSGPEQIDFETNFKSTCNKKIGSGESQPFAVPAFRTKLNATANILTIAQGNSESINFKLLEERYVTGGSICVQNAQLGDYIKASVRDIDGLIPAPYRPALCENWPIVSEYVEKQWIEVHGEYTIMKIDTYPLNAKITAGLYLCIEYFAINSGLDRRVAVNYHLTKKL